MLDELLELDATERADRLDRLAAELGAEDPGLADELHTLLAVDAAARAQRFLGGRVGPHTEPMPASLAGLSVGAYTLETPLGQGGSGTVWRARRSDGRVEGQAAVKLLHLSLLGHSAAERFRREGAILARLTHPNIAGLLDAGLTDAGQPFLVLELIDGDRIDRFCNRQRLDVDTRLRLFIDVLAAVGHAHRHLVVHRDIKPSNVLVTADGRVKLLDFGIAKLIDEERRSAEATELTRDGGRALTPEYAAPEQFQGGEVTTATDVYALGVLLYQLLSGRHPTAPPTGGSADLVRATLTTDAARLSRAVTRSGDQPGAEARAEALALERDSNVHKLSRRLRGDLDNILGRMLRKAPSERYATVDAVAEDLRRHLAHEPVSARADTWGYRAGKLLRRHRGAAVAAGITVLAIAAGVIGTVSQAQRARQQAQIAQAERDNAVKELAYAESANEFIGNVLTEGSRQPTSSVGLLDLATGLLAGQFAGAPALETRMRLMLATMYGEMREERKALAVLDQAAANAAQASTTLSAAELSHVDCLRAALRNDMPALERALARLGHPAAEPDTRPAQDRRVTAICLTRRSVLNKRAGRLQEAAADAREALRLLGTPPPGQLLPRIHARRELASAIGNQGANAEAAQEWRALLADLEAHGLGASVYAATAFNNLAVRLGAAGQELASLEQQQRSMDIWRRLQGDAAIDPQLWSNLAIGLDHLGRLAEAEATLRRALDGLRADTPYESRRSVLFAGSLSACRQRRMLECASLVQGLERMLPPDLPPGHLDRALLARARAARAGAEGDVEAERRQLEETVRIAQASAVRSNMLISTQIRLAEVDWSLGDADAGLAAARAAEAAGRTLGRGFEHSSLVGQALLAQGRIERDTGRLDPARQHLSQATVHLEATTGIDSPPSRDAREALASLDRAAAPGARAATTTAAR